MKNVREGAVFYTKNSSRVEWIQQIYPLGAQALSLLPSIRWSSFAYDGPVLCRPQKDSPSASFGTLPRTETFETAGRAFTTEYPYHVYGGAAVEVWGRDMPSIPLHSVVEPSGDIDIQMDGPLIDFQVPDEVGDEPEIILHDGTNYTQLGDAYTKWLFKEVVRAYKPLSEAVSRAPFERPERERDKELRAADRVYRAGNLVFTRVVSPVATRVLKIQVSTQLRVPSGGAAGVQTVTDHCIEFLIPPVYTFQKRNFVILNNISVQAPWELLYGQVEALADRGKILVEHWKKNPELEGKIERLKPFYKFDNHCGRILWLAKLVRALQARRFPNTTQAREIFIRPIRESEVDSLLSKLEKTNTEKLCGFHFPEWRKQFVEAMLRTVTLPKGGKRKTRRNLQRKRTRKRFSL
jgi:hypothetical protein